MRVPFLSSLKSWFGKTPPTQIANNTPIKFQSNATEFGNCNFVIKSKYDELAKKILENSDRTHWTRDSFRKEVNWDSHDVKQNILQTLNSLPSYELRDTAIMAISVSDGSEKDSLINSLMEKGLPTGAELEKLKGLIADIQFDAFKTITNHALTAEQLAVAPLSKAIVFTKARPLFQELSSQFVDDEGRHSHIFQDYLTEKLGGERKDSKSVVRDFDLFSLIVPIMPAGSVFLGLAVETVGGAFFEFFANHPKTPDPLFKAMCSAIYSRDEERHMDICETLYKALHDKENQGYLGSKWEEFRNKQMFRSIAKQVYGKQAGMDHYLMRSTQALGIDPKDLFKHISSRVKDRFARIGHKVDESLLPKL